MKKNKFNYFKKNIRKIFISSLLLSLWMFLTFSYIVSFDTSFSIWSFNHGDEDFTKITFNKLSKGDVVSGRFVARDNNLGIISIRFQTYVRPAFKYEDSFLFKIKEKNATKWYYQNIYRSGLIYDVPFFPFGIPQIANSKGKTYEFEITSLKGNNSNSISISNRYPVLETKYKYSGKDLISDKKKLLSFSLLKAYNAFKVPDVWFSSLIYLLPFLFYVFWTMTFGKKLLRPLFNTLLKIYLKLKKFPPFKYLFASTRLVFLSNFDKVILAFMMIDIFVIQLNNDIIYLVIIPLWLFIFKKNKLGSKNTFTIGIGLLIISSILLFFKFEPTAEKATIWSYIFFLTGTIQIFLEFSDKKSSNNRLGK